MKHWENTLKRYLLAVVITIGLVSVDGFAQDPFAAEEPASSAATSGEEELSLEEKIQKHKVDVYTEQPLTIVEFLEQIQQQVKEPLNVLVTRNARSVLVPEMQLRNISVQAALNAAVVAAENEISWNFEDEEVIVLDRDDGYVDESLESVSVVNAADILEDTQEASLLSAIEIGLEMRDSSKKNVSIKLHKETKLLFVKGIQDDINIVMQVVSELGGKPWPPAGSQGGFGGGGGGFGGGQGGQGGGGQGGGGLGGRGSGGGVF